MELNEQAQPLNNDQGTPQENKAQEQKELTQEASLPKKKIKGTRDVNQPSQTKGAKALRFIWSYFIITLGTLFVAVGVYFFKFPNHFTTGGVSSLSVILANYFPTFSESQFMAIANIALLIVALIIFGKQFAIKTVYSTVLLSVFTLVFEKIAPITESLTHDKLLDLLFTIGGIAVGSALLFSQNASSGGTDIIAMIFKKFTSVNIGTALLLADFVLVLFGGIAFGLETCLFSLVGLILKSFIVDNVIDGINLNKCFIIVTKSDKEICDFINNELHRGATVSVCTGSFTHDDKKMIITVLNRTQASLLKKFIKETDPTAFTIITNSTDILGKGFRIV